MALSLANQIKALEANTRSAQAQNAMSLDNRRFSLEQAKAFNQNQMDWIKLKMDWNLHAQEVIKKQIENAKSFLELQQMQFAFRQFIVQQRILKNDIRKQKIKIKANERHLANAIRVFEGGDIQSTNIQKAWRSFGRFCLTSRIIFPETDGRCFITSEGFLDGRWNATPLMSMYQLSVYCRKFRLMIDPVAPEFEFIHQVWQELTAAAMVGMDQMLADLEGMKEKLQALHQQQWTKAGLI